jgi:hypothetical protein
VVKTRVQLDLDPKEAQALDDLRDRCSLRSRADAVRTALAVVEWIQMETARGGRVFAISNDQVRSLVIPGLTGLPSRQNRG